MKKHTKYTNRTGDARELTHGNRRSLGTAAAGPLRRSDWLPTDDCADEQNRPSDLSPRDWGSESEDSDDDFGGIGAHYREAMGGGSDSDSVSVSDQGTVAEEEASAYASPAADGVVAEELMAAVEMAEAELGEDLFEADEDGSFLV